MPDPLNPFAAYLTELIHEDGRTVARIAREEGVVGSTLAAYKAGHRLPAATGAVSSIANALGLNSEKAAKLRRKLVVALDERTAARAAAVTS